MKPYLQTTEFTTAASSLLTIMHHLNPEIEFSRDKEFDIWRSTVNLPTRASSIYALANYAKKKGFNLKIVVEDKNYHFPDYRFYRYKKEEIDEASFSSNLHLKEAENLAIPIEEREISLQDVQGELDRRNIILLRLNAKPIRDTKRNTSNYVVVYGYNDKSFKIIDPIVGEISIPQEVMQESFESLETKKHRDHRMIIFLKD